MTAPANPPTPGSPEDWLRHADSDLQYAKLGSGAVEILPNQAAFHAQQAVEKAVKAMLIERQVLFGRTHDLNALIELLKQDGVQWPVDLEDAKDLTRTPYRCAIQGTRIN